MGQNSSPANVYTSQAGILNMVTSATATELALTVHVAHMCEHMIHILIRNTGLPTNLGPAGAVPDSKHRAVLEFVFNVCHGKKH